jgi:hypothetical protein
MQEPVTALRLLLLMALVPQGLQQVAKWTDQGCLLLPRQELLLWPPALGLLQLQLLHKAAAVPQQQVPAMAAVAASNQALVLAHLATQVLQTLEAAGRWSWTMQTAQHSTAQQARRAAHLCRRPVCWQASSRLLVRSLLLAGAQEARLVLLGRQQHWQVLWEGPGGLQMPCPPCWHLLLFGWWQTSLSRSLPTALLAERQAAQQTQESWPLPSGLLPLLLARLPRLQLQHRPVLGPCMGLQTACSSSAGSSCCANWRQQDLQAAQLPGALPGSCPQQQRQQCCCSSCCWRCHSCCLLARMALTRQLQVQVLQAQGLGRCSLLLVGSVA